jgi:hypothetical protein
MLAVERGTSLVFRAHNPFNRCKVQLAKRIVLIAEQTLSWCSTDSAQTSITLRPMNASIGSAPSRAKTPQPVHAMRSVINPELCK